MNSGYLQWSGPAERLPTAALLRIGVKEFRRHVIPLVTIFVVIAFAALAWGMLRPGMYTSSTTILVEDKNIMTPLMEGRSVPTANRAVIASEVVFGRRVMDQVLRSGGWMDAQPTPLEQQRLISQIRDNTTIEVTDHTRTRAEDDPGLSLIKISYTDSDSKRAKLVTESFAQLLIAESLAAKARESGVAYKFIDSELGKYLRSLRQAEAKLASYRAAHPDARPGADLEVNARIAELRRAIDTARLDLSDLSSQEAQMRTQLSSESELGGGLTRAGKFRARMAELEAERDRLALSYTDQHPDMVRLDNQMRDLERQYRSGGTGTTSRIAGTPSILGSTATLNPVYTQLKSGLASVRPQSAAAAARLATGQELLEQELARSQRIMASESTLAALTREHEVNREIYHDLLRRRESARLSMNLDNEQRDLNFHVQEPASEPLLPSGLRLMHFAGAGLLLAILAPLLLLSLVVRHDPRVRSPLQIERDVGLPVLGMIPVHLTREKQAVVKGRFAVATALFLTVPLVYGVILILKSVDAL